MQSARDTATQDRHDCAVHSAWSTTAAVPVAAEEDDDGPLPPSSLSLLPWWNRPCRRDIPPLPRPVNASCGRCSLSIVM
jgi:hypothetical protein